MVYQAAQVNHIKRSGKKSLVSEYLTASLSGRKKECKIQRYSFINLRVTTHYPFLEMKLDDEK